MKAPTLERTLAAIACFVVAVAVGLLGLANIFNFRQPSTALARWSSLWLVFIAMPAFFGISVGLIFGRIAGWIAGFALFGLIGYGLNLHRVLGLG